MLISKEVRGNHSPVRCFSATILAFCFTEKRPYKLLSYDNPAVQSKSNTAGNEGQITQVVYVQTHSLNFLPYDMEFTLLCFISAFLYTEFCGQLMPVERFRPSRASSSINPFVF